MTLAVLDNVTHVGQPAAAATAALEFRKLILDLSFKPAGIIPDPMQRAEWSAVDTNTLTRYQQEAKAPTVSEEVVLGVPVCGDAFIARRCEELFSSHTTQRQSR